MEKEKLEQLKAELLKEMIVLGKQGVNVNDHKRAIEYLNTGNKFDGEGDLLDAAINDLECLYSDYCAF